MSSLGVAVLFSNPRILGTWLSYLPYFRWSTFPREDDKLKCIVCPGSSMDRKYIVENVGSAA